MICGNAVAGGPCTLTVTVALPVSPTLFNAVTVRGVGPELAKVISGWQPTADGKNVTPGAVLDHVRTSQSIGTPICPRCGGRMALANDCVGTPA